MIEIAGGILIAVFVLFMLFGFFTALGRFVLWVFKRFKGRAT